MSASSKSDAPKQGRRACREGWSEKANPFIKGSHKHTVWDAEWKAEAAAMWLRHVKGR
jgi:CDGSH-type Zn-finger protein